MDASNWFIPAAKLSTGENQIVESHRTDIVTEATTSLGLNTVFSNEDTIIHNNSK